MTNYSESYGYTITRNGKTFTASGFTSPEAASRARLQRLKHLRLIDPKPTRRVLVRAR